MEKVYTYLVDDDQSTIESIERIFKKNDIEYKSFNEPEVFLSNKERKRICIIDYRFNDSGMTGFDIAEKVLEDNPRCNIIIITGYANTTDLLKMMNLKAFKYLSKNDDDWMDDLLKYVKQAIKLVNEEIILEKFAMKKNIR